ncbi:hypothetical protein KUV50_13705 [Membranicola marinus]|uniref:Uncharacterized protein n=1 Tax=Membranihabitans marinus TaxID=1227546 RepID=A0A953LAZ4_9BACT|nr:hypothetical protein [Membranihabitans marinus]MBY5959203.1 hypothetical protein [Membranihabitans marinus]
MPPPTLNPIKKSPIIHGIMGDNSNSPHTQKVVVLITTFHRPKLLASLLNSLQSESTSYHIEYYIYDDAVTNNGKHKFWLTINRLWEQIRDKRFDYYIHIQDDYSLGKNFISKVVGLWDSIDDPFKIGLNIFLDEFRVGKKVWVDKWPELRYYNKTRFLLNPWLDMAFICTRNLFDLLDWKILPISMQRWRHKPNLSSGVGAQISIRLFMKGKNMYQVTRSQVEHIGSDSKMNPEIRKQEPLIAFSLPLIFAAFEAKDLESTDYNMIISELTRFVDRIYFFAPEGSTAPVVNSDFKDKVGVINYPGDQITFKNKVDIIKSLHRSEFYLFHNVEHAACSAPYIWNSIRQMEDGHSNIDQFVKIIV